MPVRRAIANGNWSNTATWFGGVVPTNGDTVAANGFTVACDVDITIGGVNNPSVNAGSFVSGQWYRITFVGTTNFTSIGASANAVGIVFNYNGGAQSGTGTATALATITTLAITAASAVAGGGFTITLAQQFTPDVRAGNTNCLTVTGSGSQSYGSQIVAGGGLPAAVGVTNSSTGDITFSNCLLLGGNGNLAFAINNISSGNITVNTGTFSGSNFVGNSSTGIATLNSCVTAVVGSGTGMINSGAGAIILTASTIVGSASGANMVQNTSTGYVGGDGCVISGGTGNGPAISSSGVGGLAFTNCTYNASATANAVSGGTTTNPNFLFGGSQYDHPNGVVAVNATRYRIGAASPLTQIRKAGDGVSQTITFFTPDFGVFGNPIAADVRSGVSYGGGSLVGTAAIPSAGSVALGIPVDATTGTAVLTAADVQTALTSQGLTTTRASNLDNLDAEVSSRMETFTYTAPDNASIAAIKASTDEKLDVAVSTRSTLTQPQVQSAIIPLL